MKKSKFFKLVRCMLMIIVCIGALGMTEQVYAYELEAIPSESMQSAPELKYNQDYFCKQRAKKEYVKFRTIPTHAYYRIRLTNISAATEGLYTKIVTSTGREVGREQGGWSSSNFTKTWILDLEPNQTYYMETTTNEVTGNYGFYIECYPDNEGTTKANGVPINLNTEYTWSNETKDDEDYAVFTAPSTGTYHLRYTNISGSQQISVGIFAYASDRQQGEVLGSYYENDTEEDDYELEAGVKYYIKIWSRWGDELASKYSILLSNQKVQQISLNMSSIDLKQYDSYQLKATVSPNTAADKSVTFKSSKESVATVDRDGEVHAKAPGKATITCTANDGSGVKATCTVYVKPNKMYRPTSDKQTTNSIRLKWDKVSGANGYTIYQYNAKTKKWNAVKSTTKTSYTVSKLKKTTSYKFKVAAYLKKGSKKVYGPKSDSITAATVPSKASFSSIKQGGKSNYWYRRITLKAKKIKGASGYQFAYSTSKKGTYYSIHTGSSTYKTSFYRGRTFYYKVRAYKKVGSTYYYGAYSSPKKVKIKR